MSKIIVMLVFFLVAFVTGEYIYLSFEDFTDTKLTVVVIFTFTMAFTLLCDIITDHITENFLNLHGITTKKGKEKV